MTLALPVLLQLALGLGSDPYVRSRVQSNGDPALWPCLWWGTSGVQFDQSDLGNPVTGEASFAAVSSALASWQAVMSSCGSLNLSEGARLASRSIGYDPGSSANPNLILFRTRSCSSVVPPDDPCLSNGDCGNQYDCWPYGANVIALTTTHFKIESGQILHADIELNAAPRPYGYYFTTADAPPCTTTFSQSCVAWDIQATMTHEFGHSLGLDHTSYPTSIMTPTSNMGDTWKRTIDAGSRQFVCDIYPAGLPPRDCHKLVQLEGSTTCPSASQENPDTCHHTPFGCSAPGSDRSSIAALLGVLLWLLSRSAAFPKRGATE